MLQIQLGLVRVCKAALITSRLYMKAERPKNKDPNCRRRSVLTAEDKIPARNRYSRRLESRAAPEKQANTATDPRNAIATILPIHRQHQHSVHYQALRLHITHGERHIYSQPPQGHKSAL
jgi:hypothetical protein